jgi:multidrug efflux system membrane fusion protein
MSLPPRRWFLYSLVALVFVAGVWYFGFREQPKPSSSGWGSFRRGNSAIPVRAVAAAPKEFSVHLRAIGTVTPLNTVTVRSRVEGQLLRLAFQEGQSVAAGQLLAEIDPEPYRIRLAQAEAQLRQDEAQLRTVRSDFERFKQLHAQTLVTQQQLEAQEALVAQRDAVVAEASAQVEDAKRQLAYTRIEAPISGRLGLRHVDVGNLVRPGDQNGLVTLTQTRPISVVFTVPEIDLQKVLEPIRAGQALAVEAWDRGEQTKLAEGEVRTIDNQIDLATGTLRLKAEFANADDRLFPNQFVNVRLRVLTVRDAVVVPAAAVQFGSRGTYVYLVSAENKATVRDIVLGPSNAEDQAVLKGLAIGDRVILEGTDQLREGRGVMIVRDDGTVEGGPPGAGGDGKKGGGSGEGKKGGKRRET